MIETSTQTNHHPEKICTTCGDSKPLDEFYADNRAADGRYSDCKSCHVKKTVSGRKYKKKAGVVEQFVADITGRWRNALDSISRRPRCEVCRGAMAKVNERSSRPDLCRCVYHKIHADLMDAYAQSRGSAGIRGEITEHHCPGFGGGLSYSRKNQEFVADVEILTKRVAQRLDIEYTGVFPFHLVLSIHMILDGNDWALDAILRRYKIEDLRRSALMAISRLKVEIAKEAVEVTPYPLFPVKAYFAENTVINTMTSQPARKSAIRQALATDHCGRSAARYGTAR